jgi:CheY-like chemotaxis protein/anti-sigma regulatory factor (Ser/Thr protein kinase)
MSRIISGKVRLEVQRVDLAAVMQAAVETLRPTAETKGVRLQAVLDPHAGPVNGDPNRLQQIFWNLLSNAVKFTQAGGRIEVQLLRDANQLRLSITDAGEGIDPEFLPHVFDRFRQADSTSSRRHGGLGIGLTIVQHIVTLHRGTVRAHSEGKGHGSTFTVALPVAAVVPAGERPGPEGCVGSDLPSLKDVRVLVVDDEPDAREIVAKMLRKCDAEVSVAGSVSEALQEFVAQRPDVVVTDLAMPERDGFALLRELSRLTDLVGHPTPAIALTAYARPEDQHQTSAAGFVAHLAKPVNPAELITTVHRHATSAAMSSVANAVGSRQASPLRTNA